MFFAGLDLGQTTDPSALLILEAHGEDKRRSYDVRHIQQFTLGTSYPNIVRSATATLDREPLRRQCRLVIDHTGVGRPVFDMFTEAGLTPIGITITGGTSWHRQTQRQWHVAKSLLVSMVQKFLQSGRLRIGATLPQASILQQELRDFRVKITKAANETYEAREGQHDDLTLALACGLFVAEHPGQKFAPIGAHEDEMEAEDGAGWRPLAI